MLLPSQTKIVATLGPASESAAQITALLQRGVNVVRLNFSHGQFEEHQRRIDLVRKISKKLNIPVGILQDLPGPKIRVGAMPVSALEIKAGEKILLVSSTRKNYSSRCIPISYPPLTKDVKPGQAIYIADGIIRLVVKHVGQHEVTALVTHGGKVRPGNGVNMPDSALTLNAFTKKDQACLAFGLEQDIDFVGVSFVGNENDMKRVRSFCLKKKKNPFLIAKIERRQALNNLESIFHQIDGVMVARGDLGVEVPFFEIPGIQRHITMTAHKMGKPVILATQVLESMIHQPRPTRAEATDIANAVREQADAIMLSGETAAGEFPLEAVTALADVIRATEKEIVVHHDRTPLKELSQSSIVIREACDLAESIKASLIVIPTRTGQTAARVSHFRPTVPILAMVHGDVLRRLFSLYWGVRTAPVKRPVEYQNIHFTIRTYLLKHRLAKPGQTVILVGGAPGVIVGQTAMVQLLTL